MAEASGQTGSGLGKYSTLFELDQGGAAKVSLAVAPTADGSSKLLVVKQLRSLYAQDRDFCAMFISEARLSARLDHPNVVRVYEVLERGPSARILMEYIEGQTLDAMLALPPPKLPLALHLRVLVDVLKGLHYSHELADAQQRPLGVVHRDVSPHNVMVTYAGAVKLLDFGIAKLAGSDIETKTGVIKGKLRYMSPEQVAGEDVDRRADVFAVGVMLWEALSGVKLWKGLSDPPILKRVLAGEIPEPRNATAPIAPELVDICNRALAPSREERFETAQEFQQRLEGFLAKEGADVSPRALGAFVSQRFAEARMAEQNRLQHALEDVGAETDGAVRHGVPAPQDLASVPLLSARSHLGPVRSQLWLYALAFVGLGVAILGVGLRQRLARAALERPVPTSPAAAASVTVSIDARPAHAEVRLDGMLLSNPYRAVRARDGQAHHLRVTAAGFTTEASEVRFDRDLRLFCALAPLPSAQPAAPHAPPASSEAPDHTGASGAERFPPASP